MLIALMLSHSGQQHGTCLGTPVFWTGSFLKTSCKDRQKFLGRFFNFDFWGVINEYLSNKPSSRTQQKCKLPFLTH